MNLLIIDDNFDADDPAVKMTTIKFPDIEPLIYKTGKDFFEALKKEPTILFQSIIILDLSFGSGQMQGIDLDVTHTVFDADFAETVLDA